MIHELAQSVYTVLQLAFFSLENISGFANTDLFFLLLLQLTVTFTRFSIQF